MRKVEGVQAVNVSLKDGKTFPESFADYDVECDWTEANLPKGIKLNLRHEGRSIGLKQG